MTAIEEILVLPHRHLDVGDTYAQPMYLTGKWHTATPVCRGIFAVCSAARWFTWYKTLPEN